MTEKNLTYKMTLLMIFTSCTMKIQHGFYWLVRVSLVIETEGMDDFGKMP